MQERERTFAIVHVSPTPYRIHMFTKMQEEADRRHIQFVVHHLSDCRGERAHWEVGDTVTGFHNRTWRDYLLQKKNSDGQFNPGLILHMALHRHDVVMIGGTTASWTALALSLMPFISRQKKIVWLELNLRGKRPRNKLSLKVHQFLCSRFDQFAVPGTESIDVVDQLGYGERDQCALLPNIVDESRFDCRRPADPRAVERMKRHLGIREGKLLAFWPARLIPAKGILEFLAWFDPEVLKRWDIVIVGMGPLESEIRQKVAALNAQDSIRLIPLAPYEDMPAAYRLANMLLLPSQNDPNPLSVVEAMWSGVPVLLSTHAGNFSDALVEGINGWAYNPDDRLQAQQGMDKAFGSSREQLHECGLAARDHVATFWDSAKSIGAFFDSLGL